MNSDARRCYERDTHKDCNSLHDFIPPTPLRSPANENQRPNNIPKKNGTTNKQIPMLTKNHTMKIAL